MQQRSLAMSVATILKGKTGSIITISETDSVKDAAALLAQKKIGAVIVTDCATGKVLGILSERDIVRGLSDKGPSILEETVSSLMTRTVVSCSPDDSVERIMQQMTEGRFRHMPVMSGERLVGVISIGDVVKSRLNQLEAETEAMRSYITQ